MENLSPKEEISRETNLEIQQMRMFGCTTKEMKQEFEEASNKKIYLMGIISDAQEIDKRFEGAIVEKIRNQLLNKAKYIIDNFIF